MLREVFGTPGETIGHYHLVECIGVEICVIVVGNQLVGKTVVEQLGVEYAALGNEVAHADIVVFHEHVDVGHTRPARLRTHIGKSVARSCRYGHNIAEPHAILHKCVKHATGEHSAHTSALKYQCGGTD